MNDEYSFPADNNALVEKSRRRFIKGSGSLIALGSLPAYLSANTDSLRTTLIDIKQRQGLVLFREKDKHSVAFADTLSQAGIQPVALSDDPVRQWRDGLGELIVQGGQPLMGLSNWADYFVINGLAAEQRKHVMLELQHAVIQSGKENWAASLAIDYLKMPENADRKALQTHFKITEHTRQIPTGSRTLFSWLIA